MPMTSEIDIPHAIINRYARIGSARSQDDLFSPRRGVSPDDYANALTQRDGDAGGDAPLAIYVHLPFCPVRCLDCDNNATITHDPGKIDRYLDGLEREVSLMAATLDNAVPVQQLHIGGGSPNYLSDRQLVRLMSILDRHFTIDADTETSLDANPKRTSLSQLALLHGLGFQRVNFGVRDLDPTVQLSIGRTNSIDMIRDVFDSARDVGFKSVSTDITYGLPRQSAASMESTIENILELSPDRISCFAFTRRAAERAHQRAIDPGQLPSLADKLALFNGIVEGLADDYTWIGLDSFARHDDELCEAQKAHRLRKNWIGYTQLPPSDLLGFGTNAISDTQGFCVQNHLEISSWQGAVGSGVFPIRGGVRLCTKDRRRREAINQLMCNMELRDYADLFDADASASTSWSDYARDGLLSITPECLSITPHGRYVLPQLWSAGASSTKGH